MNKLLFIALALLAIFNSCKKEETNPKIPSVNHPIYISNEGAFGFNNASISIYNPDNQKVINKAFKQINNRGLGDVLQSTHRIGNQLYMMVNASGKIEIADATTLQELGTISNVPLCRYMVDDGKMAYVSSWDENGKIVLINTENQTVVSTLAVGKGPEKLLISDDKLLVCNGGGFDKDSSISIIDITAWKTDTTLFLGDAPMDIVQTSDNKIWVLCKGQVIYDASWQVIGHTVCKLVQLSTTGMEIESETVLFQDQHPSQMAISSDGNTLYIGGGFGFQGLYAFNTITLSLSPSPISTKSFYGIGADWLGNIYGFESPDFTSAGKMIIMDSEGKIQGEETLGVGPNGMAF